MSIGKWADLRSRYQGYSGARPDVLALVPRDSKRVLDIGCGAGLMAQLARELGLESVFVGVEPELGLASHARQHMDHVVEGRVDDPETFRLVRSHGPYDLIICADVLEHVAEPRDVLQSLMQVLAPNGHVITSLPNVRHISTFISLGMLGSWPTRSRGIHDRTHLRFFARTNILRLGRSIGLEPIRERRNLRLIESQAWSMVPAKLLDFWPFRGFLTFQYLHLWKRGRVQP